MKPTLKITRTDFGRAARRSKRWRRFVDIFKLDIKRVYDADLEGYFDSIPHEKLLACVRHRIADRRVVKRIRLWLEAPVVEEGEHGEGKDRGERSRKGTPQGGVISPLLANSYLHGFDKVFLRHRASPARGGSAKRVRYAADFVVMMKGRDVALEAFIEERLEARMGLKLNRDKTRVVELREEGASLSFWLPVSMGPRPARPSVEISERESVEEVDRA